mmetsp:Transcript_9332/g.20237  ORF Transcript_9332/g.20237 Transcript_9332/m.20237 type:complete len:311 (+) Transcript_9332:631-1563(+)
MTPHDHHQKESKRKRQHRHILPAKDHRRQRTDTTTEYDPNGCDSASPRSLELSSTPCVGGVLESSVPPTRKERSFRAKNTPAVNPIPSIAHNIIRPAIVLARIETRRRRCPVYPPRLCPSHRHSRSIVPGVAPLGKKPRNPTQMMTTTILLPRTLAKTNGPFPNGRASDILFTPRNTGPNGEGEWTTSPGRWSGCASRIYPFPVWTPTSPRRFAPSFPTWQRPSPIVWGSARVWAQCASKCYNRCVIRNGDRATNQPRLKPSLVDGCNSQQEKRYLVLNSSQCIAKKRTIRSKMKKQEQRNEKKFPQICL